jgi:hypothetical protein
MIKIKEEIMIVLISVCKVVSGLLSVRYLFEAFKKVKKGDIQLGIFNCLLALYLLLLNRFWG